MLKSTDKIAVWMESSLDDDYGKMGISALRYLDNEILCVVDSVFAGKDISEVSIIKKKIPILETVEKAKSMGANVLLLGVLTSGGVRPKSWDPVIKDALEKGMSIINGLHDQISPDFTKYIVNQTKFNVKRNGAEEFFVDIEKLIKLKKEPYYTLRLEINLLMKFLLMEKM